MKSDEFTGWLAVLYHRRYNTVRTVNEMLKHYWYHNRDDLDIRKLVIDTKTIRPMNQYFNKLKNYYNEQV